MRMKVFAARNSREMLRDFVTYIFTVGVPLLMLVVMTFVNESLPASAHVDIFRIDQLAPGIAVFAFTFLMLNGALLVSKDRSTALLTRLYASPMNPADYLLGYTLPLLMMALGQYVVLFSGALIISSIVGIALSFSNILLTGVVLVPVALLFITMGLLFGTLFNDKAAPPVSSLFITLSTIIGGVWMDIAAVGGAFEAVCNLFPFYHAVKIARSVMAGQFDKIDLSLLVVLCYTVIISGIAVIVFKNKMKSDA